MSALSSEAPRVLITGTAGFIGFHLTRLLLAEGFRVQGYDRGIAYDVGGLSGATCG